MELGKDLPVIPSPQAKLIDLSSKLNGYRLFLIDDAAGGAQSHAHRELVTKQQIHLLGGKERTSSQSVHGLNFAGMEVEASHALCLVTHGEKDPQPALVHLFV